MALIHNDYGATFLIKILAAAQR